MARKVDVGSVLSRTWETYTSQFTLLIPAALAVFLPIAIVVGLTAEASLLAAGLVSTVLTLVGVFLYQGMVIEAAADLLDGRRDQTLGSLFGGAAPFILPLLAAGLMVGVLTFFGLFLLLVGALLVYALFAVTAPSVVLERLGPIQAMKRSVEFVKDQFLPVLGVVVVVLVVMVIASTVLRFIFGAVDDGFIGYSLGSLIAQVLLARVTALASSILYFDLSGYVGAATPQPAPGPVPAA